MPRLGPHMENCLHCDLVKAIADFAEDISDEEILKNILHVLKDCLSMNDRFKDNDTITIIIDLKAHKEFLERSERALKEAADAAMMFPGNGKVQ